MSDKHDALASAILDLVLSHTREEWHARPELSGEDEAILVHALRTAGFKPVVLVPGTWAYRDADREIVANKLCPMYVAGGGSGPLTAATCWLESVFECCFPPEGWRWGKERVRQALARKIAAQAIANSENASL